MNPYEVLGVPPDADTAAIRAAYKRKAKETHPDAGGDQASFQAVTLAHRILSDKEKRERYDREGTTDDSSGNSIETHATDLVAQVMNQLFEHPDAPFIDLVEEARRLIRQMKDECLKAITKAKGDRERYRKLRKRFKVKKGRDLIGQMLDHKDIEIGRALPNMERQVGVFDRALELVADAVFEADKRPAPTPFGTSAFSFADLQSMAKSGLFDGPQPRRRGF